VIAVAAVLVLSLAGGAALVFGPLAAWRRSSGGSEAPVAGQARPEAPPAPTARLLTSGGRRTLVVSQDRDLAAAVGRAHFGTLREAVAQAEPGDVIRVVGNVLPGQEDTPALREQLVLGRDTPRNLTIEGVDRNGEPQPVAWHPPSAGPPGTPLLDVSGVQRLVLRGFRFDGAGRLDHLVTVAGYVPGLRLEQASFGGYRHGGLRLRHCIGERDEPVTFQQLRFTASDLLKAESAVVVEAAVNQANQEIGFRDCRFEGPAEAAFRLSGTVTYLEVRRSRFFKTDAAFLVLKTEPRGRLRLGIQNNTFAEVNAVFDLQALPDVRDGEPRNRITLRNNLFADTAALVRVEESLADASQVKLLFPSPGGNVRQPAACLEGVFFSEVSPREFELLSKERDNDAHFLRYAATSFLMSAGYDKTPVGVPPPE
jgi:hypothetical protein